LNRRVEPPRGIAILWSMEPTYVVEAMKDDR